jgi:hypothetical protein
MSSRSSIVCSRFSRTPSRISSASADASEVGAEPLPNLAVEPATGGLLSAVARIARSDVSELACHAGRIPESRCPRLAWVDRELLQELRELDYLRTVAAEQSFADVEIDREDLFVPRPIGIPLSGVCSARAC